MKQYPRLILLTATLSASPAFAQGPASAPSGRSEDPRPTAPSTAATATTSANAESGAAASPPPTASPTTAPPMASEAPSTREERGAIDWEGPMRLYQLGDAEQAYEQLRSQILACSDASPCSDEALATLYFCLGIVQSGGMERHQAAVTAFTKARTLNPEVGLLPEYDKPVVRRAFDESRGVTTQEAKPRPTPIPLALAEEPEDDDNVPGYYQGRKKKTALLLITGSGRYSYIDIYGPPDPGDDYYYSNNAYGERFQGSGAVTFVAMPVGGFSLGGRARGGVYAGSESVAFAGASAVMGATVGPRVDGHFMTFLGTMGIEWAPEYRKAGFNFGVVTSFGLGGFTLGPAADFVVSENYVAASFGMELGFGALL